MSFSNLIGDYLLALFNVIS